MKPRKPEPTKLVALLSPRQSAILTLACEELNDREIGQRLGISKNTVRTHWNFIHRTLWTHSRVGACLCYKAGVTSTDALMQKGEFAGSRS